MCTTTFLILNDDVMRHGFILARKYRFVRMFMSRDPSVFEPKWTGDNRPTLLEMRHLEAKVGHVDGHAV